MAAGSILRIDHGERLRVLIAAALTCVLFTMVRVKCGSLRIVHS